MLILLALLLCHPPGLMAQSGAADTLRTEYDFVKRSDPWLTGPNAAALVRFSSRDMAKAELSLTRAKGGFTDFYDSPSVLQAGASVEAFCRLSPRTVAFGSMSYDNFSGSDMAGSAFMHNVMALPATHLPFDIVEDSLTNTGRKHRDTYQLRGAVATAVANGFAVGLSLGYTSANYAKYKDLRHKNKLMDLDFTAGIYLGNTDGSGSILQGGACYTYRRTTQSVLFSTYGKSDRTYNSFINYGPYIGVVEQFGSTGYTDKSREMPLVDDYDGASLQIGIGRPQSAVSFYSSVSYAHRRGYYGRRSPYTITYTGHHSNIYAYTGRLTAVTRASRFCLDVTMSTENLQNDTRVYREQRNDAGATYYEYYTPVKAANRLWTDGTAALTADIDIRNQVPAWTLQAGTAWQHRKQTAYLFPDYRRQDISSKTFFSSVTRNILTRSGLLTLQADVSFTCGSGEPFEDGMLQEPSDKHASPATMDAYLWREYLWLTANQYTVGGTAKYCFSIPKARLTPYVKASLHHHKANVHNEYLAGRDRTTAAIAIGCEF
ncbi:MAG: hypothetical protein IJT98_09575 [Prevotella sp.]|nr:hypothetical protein [Prevotella sp.]